MGNGTHYTYSNVRLTPSQSMRIGSKYQPLQNLLGEYYAVSYKDTVNGITVIRTRWIRRKSKRVKKKKR